MGNLAQTYIEAQGPDMLGMISGDPGRVSTMRQYLRMIGSLLVKWRSRKLSKRSPSDTALNRFCRNATWRETGVRCAGCGDPVTTDSITAMKREQGKPKEQKLPWPDGQD